VIIGEDELAAGKVKIKENGLREGHPEKEGVLVNLSELVSEVRRRIERRAELENMTQQAEGLKVVGGIRGEPGQSEARSGEAEQSSAAKNLISEEK
jgi:histidyl-tRNA synthetase